MTKNYDVIVIGAGSLGVPTALFLAEQKLSVLVIEPNAAPGQGNNKKAIGGIRATHSDYGKIHACLRSIEIFSTWQEKYGDDIEWMANGYAYPAYDAKVEKALKDLLVVQKSFGLNIDWVSPERFEELVPGVTMDGLRGATFSPEDGSASPLASNNAFFFKSKEFGAEYAFNETVVGMKMDHNRVITVQTNKNQYSSAWVVNCAGNAAHRIGEMVGLDVPVTPDCHEGAISEPVARFFGPMVVDIRPAKDSKNYYFYQNRRGQVVFCITPDPMILGEDRDSTSAYLPLVAPRMIALYPRLANLKVRRTWRGQYPNTPDGFPIVGKVHEVENYVNNVGPCGQGFMLGPGLGELVMKIILDKINDSDRKVMESFDFYRSFSGDEALK